MTSRYESLSFHAGDEEQEVTADALRGFSDDTPADADLSFSTDEAAARFYLDQVMGASASPQMRSLRSPERPERVPDFQKISETATPINTRLVGFEQTHHSIPVFGSRVTVELSESRGLVGAKADLLYVEGVKPIPSLAPGEALSEIEAFTEASIDEDEVDPPQLQFFLEEVQEIGDAAWHLVWLFRDVPATPPGRAPSEPPRFDGHGLATSMRTLYPLYDYLVDAHTGKVVHFYSSTPTMAVPTKVWGLDEADRLTSMWGSKVDDKYVLSDPLHNLLTYDLGLQDVVKDKVPEAPISSDNADLDKNHRAAVTAYANAKRVQDFYKTVLGRDGIDGKGMDLVSVVNCTVTPAGRQYSEEWNNAVWWRKKMWYGQTLDGEHLVSLARFLDVIAHELTHGVTGTSSQLVYENQSGALSESFSDIFGIIIKNWWEAESPQDTGTWNFELGPGLGDDGPLRDLSDPTRTGQPDHMDDYDPDPEGKDHGGVHTNSNIHNKAAYQILTAKEADDDPVFPVEDAAVLFYLTLIRLAPKANFVGTREMMVDNAKTMYAGDVESRDRKIAVIEEAYDAVGI